MYQAEEISPTPRSMYIYSRSAMSARQSHFKYIYLQNIVINLK